ncbi:MAG: hypothetical protein GY778_23955 [bacterium]|nr:hypothetical protein [bacterium]
MAETAIRSLSIFPLAIPLRRKVSHAASQRAVADPVVVGVELMRGTMGYGETLPRPYVTGETVASVQLAIGEVFVPALLELHPASFPEALEAIDQLPWRAADGQPVPAARAAVELALLDVYARHFERPLSDVPGWMGLGGFGSPGSTRTLRYSGVLAADSLRSTLRTLRLLWWYGLRHFKLKVGLPDDVERVRTVARWLGSVLRRGRATLRLDANGAWTTEQAIAVLTELADLPLAGVEQPLGKGNEADLTRLREIPTPPIIHDESLVTLNDARSLSDRQLADGFNIRISKCGGLLPSLRLARFARQHNALIQLGCMVGETSILSAAGRAFLEMVPQVVFAEGWFGSFLLSADVVRRPLRFGYGGRGRSLSGPGLGVTVDPVRLAALAADKPIELAL